MADFTLSKVDLSGVEQTLMEANTKELLLLERDERSENAGPFRKSGVIYRVTNDEGQEVEWDE